MSTADDSDFQHISPDDISDIYKVMQDPSVQNIFSNKDLLAMMFENEVPTQESLEKMMDNEDVNNVFHNQILMSEIIRLKNRIYSDKQNAGTEIKKLSDEESEQIESEHGELVTLFVNMGYPKENVLFLIKTHGTNVQSILNDLNL